MLLAMGAATAALPIDVAGGQRKRRLSTSTSVAIGLSLAVHAAVGVYLYTQRFELRAHTYDAPPPPTLIDMIRIRRDPPPPPPPPPPRPDRPQVVRHDPAPVHHAATPPIDTPRVDTSPIHADPNAHLAAGTVFSSLPDGPAAESGGSVTSPPEPPHTITQPNWLSRPNGEEMARLYPDRAQRMNISGRAVINCTVDARGRLQSCSIASETPSEYGFGDAAVRLSRYFRMSPRTVDGAAVDGGEVRIPIQFTIPDR